MATIIRNSDIKYTGDETKTADFGLLTATPRFNSLVGSENLVFDLRRLDPGCFSFPYHYHRHAEELLLVLSGELTLRTGKGFDILKPGDLAYFGKGEKGAHQYFNHGSESCTYLDVRTFFESDVCIYPDSGKINVLPENEVYQQDSRIGYFTGEDRVREKWAELGYPGNLEKPSNIKNH